MKLLPTLLIIVLIASSILRSQVTVSGAGSSVANGVYVFDEILHGHNRYEKFDANANCAVEYYGQWEIFCTQFSPWMQFTYYVGVDSCDPGELDPPPDGWELGTDASAPVPMLSGDLCSTALSVDPHSPTVFQLEIVGTMPNPFNPFCTIEYRLSTYDRTILSIYNLKGEKVSRLQDAHQNIGTHRVVWEANNQPSGIYIVHLTNGSEVQTQKILLLK